MSGTDKFGLADPVQDKQRQAIKPPRKYQVVLNNDDYTPMDFVVEVLTEFFNMDEEKATEVMLKVHYDGQAVCGIYSAEIAETKTAMVNQYARDNDHPLLCSYEPVG
jgi:ATP-dependent Clp protease adaptor protein ClpS